MLILCITGAGGHYTMIKALEIAEASSLQPFSYLQLLFASMIGVFVFGEVITIPIVVVVLLYPQVYHLARVKPILSPIIMTAFKAFYNHGCGSC